METESLSSILEHDEAPAVVAEAKPDTYEPVVDEPEVKQDPVPEKVEVKAEPKLEPKVEEKPRVDVAAIMDERRKRQALEREVAELRGNKPKPDFFENPDAAISSRLGEAVAPLESQIFNLKLELAKTRYADFDEVVVSFLQAAEKDPVLKHQADTAPDPLMYIYREGKRLKELAPFDGDIDKLVSHRLGTTQAENLTLKQQLAAVRAEVDALKKQAKELDEIPRSLNSAPSASSPKAEEEDDEDLTSIFRNKF